MMNSHHIIVVLVLTGLSSGSETVTRYHSHCLLQLLPRKEKRANAPAWLWDGHHSHRPLRGCRKKACSSSTHRAESASVGCDRVSGTKHENLTGTKRGPPYQCCHPLPSKCCQSPSCKRHHPLPSECCHSQPSKCCHSQPSKCCHSQPSKCCHSQPSKCCHSQPSKCCHSQPSKCCHSQPSKCGHSQLSKCCHSQPSKCCHSQPSTYCHSPSCKCHHPLPSKCSHPLPSICPHPPPCKSHHSARPHSPPCKIHPPPPSTCPQQQEPARRMCSRIRKHRYHLQARTRKIMRSKNTPPCRHHHKNVCHCCRRKHPCRHDYIDRRGKQKEKVMAKSCRCRCKQCKPLCRVGGKKKCPCDSTVSCWGWPDVPACGTTTTCCPPPCIPAWECCGGDGECCGVPVFAPVASICWTLPKKPCCRPKPCCTPCGPCCTPCGPCCKPCIGPCNTLFDPCNPGTDPCLPGFELVRPFCKTPCFGLCKPCGGPCCQPCTPCDDCCDPCKPCCCPSPCSSCPSPCSSCPSPCSSCPSPCSSCPSPCSSCPSPCSSCCPSPCKPSCCPYPCKPSCCPYPCKPSCCPSPCKPSCCPSPCTSCIDPGSCCEPCCKNFLDMVEEGVTMSRKPLHFSVYAGACAGFVQGGVCVPQPNSIGVDDPYCRPRCRKAKKKMRGRKFKCNGFCCCDYIGRRKRRPAKSLPDTSQCTFRRSTT